MTKEHCQKIESEACGMIVAFGGGARTRSATARALRSWRSIGDHDRARWFRRHVSFITGHLFKDARRHSAMKTTKQELIDHDKRLTRENDALHGALAAMVRGEVKWFGRAPNRIGVARASPPSF